MKAMTGHIRLSSKKTVPVKCYPVKFDGFEQYEFFLHRAVFDWFSDSASHPETITGKGWRVTEKSTGYSIMGNRSHGKTKAEAIAFARENLETYRDRFLACIKNAERITQ